MFYSNLSKTIALSVGVLATVFLIGYFVFAWTEPTEAPPGGNVPAPLNVSLTAQAKEGALVLATNSGVTTGLIVQYGNVGIGTPTPDARLDVVGDLAITTGSGITALKTNWDGGIYKSNAGGVYPFHNTHNLIIQGWDDGTNHRDLVFVTGAVPTVRAVIKGSTGSVGIGTTDPGAKLDVSATGDGTELLRLSTERAWTFRQTSTGASAKLDLHALVGNKSFTVTSLAGNRAAEFFTSDTAASNRVYLVPDGGSVGIGTTDPGSYRLRVNGNVAATAFYYTSDIDLKTNVKPLSNSLEKILNLQGVSFNWKDNNNEPSIGLIAQDVEKIFPEAVFGPRGEKTIDYARLVAPLIEAIKEQQKEIEELKAEINELKLEIK